jgi:hypothetical protein
MMRVTRWLILGLALFAVAGCQPLAPTPGFGSAVNKAAERMVVNPKASVEDTERAEGLEGPTAQGVVDNYHKGQQEGARDDESELKVGF